MMKSIALVLGLALTATAGAQPRTQYGERDRETYRHDGQWTELASATSTRNGTEFFNVGRDAGRFSQVRIVADDGRVLVRRVTVMFEDGGKRSFAMARTVGKHHDRDVVVRLDGARRISQIAVTTDRGIAGTYSVFGG